MEDVSEMLAEQQRELERIRKKRGGNHDTERVRQILNIAFMILALAGIIIYFAYPERHVTGLSIIATGMVLKIVEFFIRFMF